MQNKQTILVVEDERPLAEAIKIKLKLNNFEVVTASSVDSALNFLKDNVVVDAIWLDHYLLGKENGLDLVSLIKNDGSKWKSIPVFVVSNTASADKVGAYLKLGVNKYYAKSDFRLEQIINDIKATLNKESDEKNIGSRG